MNAGGPPARPRRRGGDKEQRRHFTKIAATINPSPQIRSRARRDRESAARELFRVIAVEQVAASVGVERLHQGSQGDTRAFFFGDRVASIARVQCGSSDQARLYRQAHVATLRPGRARPASPRARGRRPCRCSRGRRARCRACRPVFSANQPSRTCPSRRRPPRRASRRGRRRSSRGRARRQARGTPASGDKAKSRARRILERL